MCGICGLIWLRPGARNVVRGTEIVRRMLDAMGHRGPDGEGVEITERAAIGHLRLSIIDIEGGAQPMANPDGNVHLSYNGEVYNYQDLMRGQRGKGWTFATQSDTETLLAGYILDGDGFDNALSGMYAYAILDCRSGRDLVQIGIDPVGIKPLFLAETPQGMIFASELRGVVSGLVALGESIHIDREAVAQYLMLGWVPAPRTLVRGVRRLAPGERMQIPFGDRDIVQLPTRPLPAPAMRTPDLDALGTNLDAAVRRQLMSDVPVGFFLSGGIDSSLLVGAARRIGIRPRTFTVRFTGIGHGVSRADEADIARLVAEHCGAEHHELEVSATTLAGEIDAAFAAMDQPIADPACLPLLVMARFAREHVKVCLSGDGGDELFLGYPRHWIAGYKKRWNSLAPPLRAAAQRLAAHLPAAPGNGLTERLRKLRVGIELVSTADYFTGPFSGRHADALGHVPALPHWARDVAADDESLFESDMLGQLAGQMLPKTDHVTMYASLETRVPFLDPEIVVAARAMPMAAKMAGRTGKLPLRALLSRHLPPEVSERPKQGFRVPLTSWFRSELVDQVRGRLLDGSEVAAGILDRATIERLVSDHISGRAEHSVRIWALLALQSWLESLPEARP